MTCGTAGHGGRAWKRDSTGNRPGENVGDPPGRTASSPKGSGGCAVAQPSAEVTPKVATTNWVEPLP
jgi:hypothetical protein